MVALAAPAGATTREDLRDARAELAHSPNGSSSARRRSATRRAALTTADARVDQATGRLAAATVLRARLDERLASVRARLAAAQD